jgi:hypothetical protein
MKDSKKMLYQFAILLLAALLGIAGSVDIVDDDNTPRKILTPIVISMTLCILLNHSITQHSGPAAKLPGI